MVHVAGDGKIFRNALVASLVIAGGVCALGWKKMAIEPAAPLSATAPAAEAPAPSPPANVPHREALALSPEQKQQGMWECMMPDPGLGLYGPMRRMLNGFVHVPRSGGHTDDMGYDVILHFHGFPAVRKAVVPLESGIVFAGVDLGNGSSAYSDVYSYGPVFQKQRESLEQALKDETGDPRAHIRHLALSAWSAGYGAINLILKNGHGKDIDGVILLDGFHSNYDPKAGSEGWEAVDGERVLPLISFAEQAAAGEKFFYFSHSAIMTNGYPSTTKVATYLLDRMHLTSTAAEPTDDPLGLESYVDEKDFHVRAFGGQNEAAHCDHTRNIKEVIETYLKPRWQTPPAERAASPAPSASR